MSIACSKSPGFLQNRIDFIGSGILFLKMLRAVRLLFIALSLVASVSPKITTSLLFNLCNLVFISL